MSAQTNARRLVAVPGPVDPNSSRGDFPQSVGEGESCSSCFGTGMEVVAGKGARRCRCRTGGVQTKLLEAARLPRRYRKCLLSNYQPAGNKRSIRR